MEKKKFPLTNRLIEGFLYMFLEEWKTEEELYSGILKEYGEDVCLPSELSNSGAPKYQTKLLKCLTMGIRNNLYEHNEANKKYHRI